LIGHAESVPFHIDRVRWVDGRDALAGTDVLSFHRLPPGLAGLSFRLRYRGRIVHVAVRQGAAGYSLPVTEVAGPPIGLHHANAAHYGDAGP
jgi:hypothetical protein